LTDDWTSQERGVMKTKEGQQKIAKPTHREEKKFLKNHKNM
jgi:hypothetical protein